MASATSNNSTPTNPQCCTDSTQCYTKVNEAPTTTSEMVMVTHKMVKCDDKQSELVTGKEMRIVRIHFSNSELV